jgi:rhodanese-related sulfurtransferase
MTTLTSTVLATRPAPADDAHRHFAARLRFETDVADVAADVRAGSVPYTIVDVRSADNYARAHVRGAINLPLAAIDHESAAALPEGPVVVYCWGPGCNGAHRAAHRLTRHGRQVKEMIGGIEYWIREGQPLDGTDAERLAGLAQPDLVGFYGAGTTA